MLPCPRQLISTFLKLDKFKLVIVRIPAKPAPFSCGFKRVKNTAYWKICVVCNTKTAFDFPTVLTVSDISFQLSTFSTVVKSKSISLCLINYKNKK